MQLILTYTNLITFDCRNNLDVNLYTLGAYVKIFNYASNGNKLDINRWVSSQHNMGFVLLRDVWNQIRSCSKHFCTYDDYNWDWSLQHISEKCLTKPLMTLSVIAPRWVSHLTFQLNLINILSSFLSKTEFSMLENAEFTIKKLTAQRIN